MQRSLAGAPAPKIGKRMALLVIPLAFVGCGSPENAGQSSLEFTSANREAAKGELLPNNLKQRLVALDSAVSRWQRAPDLVSAHETAEEARNLVVGAAGPYYGDADGDGTISGASSVGILPGQKGQAGLATSNDGPCVVADVLGGSWVEPADRWAKLDKAITQWTSSRNTFPSLPSHIQRVVGWASLALKAEDVREAREYAGHARLHVDVAIEAVTQCRR